MTEEFEHYEHYSMTIQWSAEDKIYVVTVPELPGCRTHGTTYEEAIKQGQDAIDSWIAANREWGRPISGPTIVIGDDREVQERRPALTRAEERALTALAGEYYVAAELCRHAYTASLTLKNYPMVDIFVRDPRTRRQSAIQVKTIRIDRAQRFRVPEDVESYERDVSALVFVAIAEMPGLCYETYVVPTPKVATLSAESRRRFIASHPGVAAVQPRMLELLQLRDASSDFRDRWELIFGW